jgi:hypothetical protein
MLHSLKQYVHNMNKPETNAEDRKGSGYPTYDLESCIKFAGSIRELGGSKEGVKKSLLAKQLGVAESTPSFFQRLSSTKVYGIIEGWGTYGLTDLGKQYFYPTTDQDVEKAILQMFSFPPVFSKLISRFDGGKVPMAAILGNILHQESGLPDSWKDRVAQIFIRNAQFAGIIDSGGFLRYDAAMHTNKTGNLEKAADQRPKFKDPLDIPAVFVPTDDAPAGINIWSYSSKGNQIKVQTPEVISKELWEKLNAYVQILKPSE